MHWYWNIDAGPRMKYRLWPFKLKPKNQSKFVQLKWHPAYPTFCQGKEEKRKKKHFWQFAWVKAAFQLRGIQLKQPQPISKWAFQIEANPQWSYHLSRMLCGDTLPIRGFIQFNEKTLMWQPPIVVIKELGSFWVIFFCFKVWNP